MAAARDAGRLSGRPAKLNDEQDSALRQLYETREHTADELAARFGVSGATVYRSLQRTAPQNHEPLSTQSR